jgi:hypothetical protein
VLVIGDDEDAFLREHRRAFLFVTRGDGSPTCYPMVGLYNDGRMEFSAYRKSAKVTRIRRSPAVGALVTADATDDDHRAVLVNGRATVVDTTSLPPSSGADPEAMGVPTEIVESAANAMRSQRRCTIRLDPLTAAFLGSAVAAERTFADPAT